MQNKTTEKIHRLSFLNSLRDAVIHLNNDGVIEFFNSSAAKLLGMSSQILTGKLFFEIFNSFDLLPLLQTHPHFHIPEQLYEVEHLVSYLKDSREKYFFNITITPEYVSDEHIICGYSILLTPANHLPSENTVSQIALENFQENINPEESIQFRALAENSPDIIYIIDIIQRRVIYFNRSEIFGHPIKDLETTEGWIELVHPEDIKKVKNHWKEFLKIGKGCNQIEYRLKKKFEEYEWVINRHTILQSDSDNLPQKILLNITVITERKKAEEALKESEARLLALIDNTTDILWSVDKDLQFTAMNSSFKTHFRNEFKKDIKVGDNLLEILPEKISIEWLKNHRKALSGRRFTTDLTFSRKKKNYSYEISYNPIYSDDGNICGACVFGRDNTLKKIAENDIIRTNFELDSFVYRASHDLRAPLRSVLGLVNIIKSEENLSQRNHYLNLVDKSINKLDSFIGDLTNFSRNSRVEVKVEKISFSSIIEDCIENLKYMDNSAFIDIRTDLIETSPFYSDAVRISIILQNLISNSIKYRNHRNECSYVNIQVNVSRNHCLIKIEDNGKGIKEEYLGKIFNMFFRASHDSYGSGLGLYITKQVVEKLNGEISVNSTLGKGSVFEINLPNLAVNN